jgi:hypothetical protein
MNARRAAALRAELCLTEGRPLAVELEEVDPGAAAAAAAGNLRLALNKLSLSRDLVVIAELWPRALHGAQRALAAVPSAFAVAMPLWVTTTYLWLVLMVQWIVMAVLKFKALPAMERIGGDVHVAVKSTAVLELYPLIILFGVLPVLALSGVMLFAGRALPGFGKHLRRAREAAMLRALLEAQAPAAAVQDWMRRSPTLSRIELAVRSEDLDSITEHSIASAQRSVERLTAFVRTAGFFFLCLGGLVLALSVYRFSFEVGLAQ